MTAAPHPPCAHCGSENVLPFEDDTPYKGDTTLFIILLSAFLVITAYVLLVFTSALYFPIVVFIAIIVTTRMINKHQADRKKRAELGIQRDYMCLDCSRFFRR